MTPAVSVVIPNYNGARWLPESVKSVLSQTEVDFELIIVDDGSDDNSCRVVTSYAKTDHRIRLIVQRRSGVSRARNAGTAIARGQFIQYLDVDDVLEQGTIAARVGALRSSGADVACCGWQWWEQGGDGAFRGGASFSGRLGRDPELEVVKGQWWPPGALLFTREALSRVLPWDEDLTIVQDWALLLRLVSRRPRIAWLGQLGLQYRRHSSAMSLNGPRFLTESFHLIRHTHWRWSEEKSLTADRRSTLTGLYRYFRSALGDAPDVVSEIDRLSSDLASHA